MKLQTISCTRGLDDILFKLQRLHVSSVLDSEAVKAVIAECNAKIDEYLKDYEASFPFLLEVAPETRLGN